MLRLADWIDEEFIKVIYRKPSTTTSRGGFSISRFWAKIKPNLKAGSKFTIHPFRSLHSRHLLPLSIPDYIARFGLELVIVSIGVFAVLANMTLSARAQSPESKDQSMLFAFLSQNPNLNSQLIAANETSTILGQTDKWIARAQAASPLSVMLASSNSQNSGGSQTTIQDNVIVKTNPASTDTLRHGKTVYEVRSGDNLVSIASSFGISPATIIKENNLDQNGVLKPGQDLTILPVDGISYTLKAGDTLEAIASKYKLDLDYLLEVNDLELASDVQTGDNIVIPTKVVIPSPTAPKKFITTNSGQVKLTQANAPANLSAGSLSFMWPTPVRSITQGFSSRHSGLDISDSKLEPIYASESGFVEIAGFQSNGYGNTIVINHGSGYKTRYAHASELYVKAGEYVTKGQVIAKQGRTGRVRGATGIHLHFEITKNGVHLNPLSFVKP